MNWQGCVRSFANRLGLKKRLPHFIVFGLVALVYAADGFETFELHLMDIRFELSERQANGGIVLVAIDAKSLRELDTWPWPRNYYIDVLKNLHGAGADRIAFEIDFSSRTDDSVDAALGRAFAEVADASGQRVILPIFKQFENPAAEDRKLAYTAPLPVFSNVTDQAFTNVRPGADSLIRKMATAHAWKDGPVVTLPALLAGLGPDDPRFFYIDFGIDPASIPQISFADVFAGRFDGAAVMGKKVVIGATAVEMGDQLAVPRYGALPGPVLEALAYESLVQDRAIQRVAPVPILIVGVLIAILGGPWLAAVRWRKGLTALAVSTVVVSALSVAMQRGLAVSLDIAPWIALLIFSYLFGLVRNIDRQAIRIFISGMAVSHTRAVMNGMIEKNLDGIFVVGFDGKIEVFNAAAAKMFRRRATDVIGKKVSLLFPPHEGFEAEGPRIARAMEKADLSIAKGKPRELSILRLGGTTLPVEVVISETELKVNSVHPLERRTERRGAFVCFFRDISERNAAQAKESELRSELAHASRLAAIGEMASGFAHELNQPLAAITNYTGGILRRVEAGNIRDPDLPRILREVSDQAQRAGEIIRRIRKFVDKEQTPKIPIAINSTIEEVVALAKGDILENDIEINLDFAENLPFTLADPVQIQQVILNLVRNGIDAICEGRPTLRWVTILTRVAEDGRVEISVSDTGIGIPASVMPHLFEPFFSTKESGMGIGLLICNTIVEEHGGTLKVESKEDVGTTISFSLPSTLQTLDLDPVGTIQ